MKSSELYSKRTLRFNATAKEGDGKNKCITSFITVREIFKLMVDCVEMALKNN